MIFGKSPVMQAVDDMLYHGIPVKVVKSKKMTKDQQIAELKGSVDHYMKLFHDKVKEYDNLSVRFYGAQDELKYLRKANKALIKKLTRKA